MDTPFCFTNRLARSIWSVVDLLLVRWAPRSCHGWRVFWLRLFGAKMGAHCHVYPGAKIWAPWNLICAERACIGEGATLLNYALITIGADTVLSQECYLCTGTHNYTDLQFPLIAKPIHIGQSVWIAAQAFVHPGITIGEGCVVGARSVVTKNLPEWTVCVGHPCKPIKERTRR